MATDSDADPDSAAGSERGAAPGADPAAPAAEPGAEPEPADHPGGAAEVPSPRLLGFYDRLRGRVLDVVERRAGKLPEDALKALLLVPDVFILLVRLTLDKEVPGKTRAMLGGALAYAVLSFDLLPRALLGPVGYLDDLVIAAAVLSQVWSGDLEPYARKHWSGPQDLRDVMHDVNRAAHSLLGANLYQRLKRLLARRDVHLPEKPDE
ncbi:MAG TPA: DUF1232 domain-containing protein [Thermoanaerobaculia bacterium]|nr:DUF1232 domain-containing protein [Thermoanaerobaculia bacterium]